MQLRRLWIGMVLACGLVLGLGVEAHGQFFRGGGNSINNPPVNQREFDMMVRMLEFDEVQKEIATELFSVVQSEFGEMSAVASEMSSGARDEFQRTRDPAVWQELGRRLADFEEKSEELGERFYEDVKILLTEEQLPKWEKFERRRFRGRAITRQEQMISGAGVDLVVLTEEMQLDDEQRELITDVVEQYEVELDRKLRAYRRVADEQQEAAEALGQDGNWMQNMEKFNEIFATVRDELIQVRAIHERYLTLLSSRLGEEASAELTSRYNRAAYPEIYRDSYVDTGLERALALDSLTGEQREFIDSVKANWEAESARLRGVLARAQREREASMRMQDMWGGQRSDEAREAQNRMRELQLRFYDQLLGVLTEEQKAGLPERPATDWRQRSFDF